MPDAPTNRRSASGRVTRGVQHDEESPRRVLLVDDDKDFADSLAILLQLEGYHVTVAYSSEAPDLLAAVKAQVALVDIRLGHRNGVQLVRDLRDRDSDLITVMMTAYASVETAIEALQAGAYDYLCKPFHTQDLLATLDRCFERNRLYEERQRAEEQLRHAQRMEAVGQLTGGIAHDFNNLLTVILGNLRLLAEQVGHQPALAELVEDALDATRSGVELTGRLLAFGRAQPLNPEMTDIGELVGTLSRLLRRTLGDEITIRLTLGPELWNVWVDRGQLEASLLNLAINARDAMSGGGELRIEADNVVLDVDDLQGDPELQPGRYVRITVTDTGSGMTPDVKERAIQPFFTTKPSGQGSGLGLSMVYGFVRQSDGSLAIASEPGRGTTVSLYFKAVALTAEVDAALAAMPSVRAGGGERILLVEDQPKVRQLLKRQLTRLGYQVMEASDARDALARLAEVRDVDVLFTDIGLPGDMNGVELCEAAIVEQPTLGLVLTTGYAPESVTERSGAIGAATILRKPVEPQMLSRTLRAVIDARLAKTPTSAAAQALDAGGTNI